jgi:hypothetical protein
VPEFRRDEENPRDHKQERRRLMATRLDAGIGAVGAVQRER